DQPSFPRQARLPLALGAQARVQPDQEHDRKRVRLFEEQAERDAGPHRIANHVPGFGMPPQARKEAPDSAPKVPGGQPGGRPVSLEPGAHHEVARSVEVETVEGLRGSGEAMEGDHGAEHQLKPPGGRGPGPMTRKNESELGGAVARVSRGAAGFSERKSVG